MLFEKLLIERLGEERFKSQFEISSIGILHTMRPLKMSKNSKLVLIKEEGINPERCERHLGKYVHSTKKEFMDKIHLFLCMSEAHKKILQRLFGDRNGIYTLREFVGDSDSRYKTNIPDPRRRPYADFQKMKETIKGCLNRIIEVMTQTGVID